MPFWKLNRNPLAWNGKHRCVFDWVHNGGVTTYTIARSALVTCEARLVDSMNPP